jgi:hypothetical protein
MPPPGKHQRLAGRFEVDNQDGNRLQQKLVNWLNGQ